MERGDERTETHVTDSTHLTNRTGSVAGTAPTGVPTPQRGARLRHVRRSIDYHALEPDDLPLLDDGEDDERATPIAWNVAVSDDYVDAEPRVVLTIEDSAGVVLKTSAIGPGPSALGFDATTTGPLFVRAAGAFGQRGAYDIFLSTQNQSDCSADTFEPNDTVSGRAILVTDGGVSATAASICESDEDFYAIDGIAGKRIVVDLTFLHGDADLDLQLLGLDGIQILATADGQVDGETIEAILPQPGIYTLRVFSLTSGAKSNYTLTTEIESP